MAAAKKKPAKKMPAKKAPAKKTAARKTPRRPRAAPGRQLSVRMYDVGFGDAFLLQIPDGNRTRRVLFDCGSIEASNAGGPMKGCVQRIIADATDPDGVARIDVVVATHRHKDHVSGFANGAWAGVEVKEVWMPWTEHPTDKEARRIRELQSKLAAGLNAALAAAPAAVNAAAAAERAVAAGIVANALVLSNEPAMTTLHSGFAGQPVRRFLPVREAGARLLETDALPGVRVHVLGPSRDPEVIRDMDPPKGESYLRLRAAIADETGTTVPPFAHEFIVDDPSGTWTFLPTDAERIAQAGSLSELAVAVALDKAVNGTSLMLLLDVAGTYLLFPGDAQWGTWLNVLDDPEWRTLLERVSFYKIGHHGSHNATPRRFVADLLPVGCCAMASTLVRTIWPEIPKAGLLTALLQKTAVVARSDKPDKAPQSFRVSPGVIEARMPF